MEEKHLPKLEIESFKTVESPPRLRWKAASRETEQERGGGKPAQTAAPWQRGWKTASAKVAHTVRSARDAVRFDTEGDKKNDDSGYRRLLIKTGICAAIAIVILGLSSIDTPIANDAVEAVDSAVNHQFDIEEDIGRLKFVQNLNDDAQSVFSPLPSAMVVYPADGDVLTSFGEGGSKGVRIVPDKSEVVSIAKGTVLTVGAIDDMGFVKVALDGGEMVVYHNVMPAVQTDDIVQPGQPIGQAVGDYIYIEMKDGDEYIDPIAYIQNYGMADYQ